MVAPLVPAMIAASIGPISNAAGSRGELERRDEDDRECKEHGPLRSTRQSFENSAVEAAQAIPWGFLRANGRPWEPDNLQAITAPAVWK